MPGPVTLASHTPEPLPLRGRRREGTGLRQRSGGRLTLAWDQYADLGDAFDVTAVVVVNDHAVALINNGNLGMVRQWQTLFYGERYSQTDLSTHSHRIPDFVKLAEALGCVGLRCERAEDVDDVINQARAINDRPVVIDFIVGADAQVWPMVAAGTGNDQIMAARNIRPLFDEDNSEGRA